MARLQGEQMLALYNSSLRTMTVTINPSESVVSQEYLPTSEPASSQVSYTVAAEHLPTISPTPWQTSYQAQIFMAGKNTAASMATIYWRILKNGISQTTGSNYCSTNYYWTIDAGNFGLVSVGDTLEVRVWASASSAAYWDYKALVLAPTRMFPARPKRILLDVSFTVSSYTLGNGSRGSTDSGTLQMNDSLGASFGVTTVTPGVWFPGSTYGIYRTARDRSPGTTLRTNFMHRPYYYSVAFVSSITYREGPDL